MSEPKYHWSATDRLPVVDSGDTRDMSKDAYLERWLDAVAEKYGRKGKSNVSSVRESLARVLAARRLPAMKLTDEARERLIQQGLYQAQCDVDAILRELMDLPAKDWFQMETDAGMYFDRSEFDKILLHILNEDRSARIPHHGRTDEKQRDGIS